MWTAADRVLVGDYGSGQSLSDDQDRLLEPFIPPAKPGGRRLLRTWNGGPKSGSSRAGGDDGVRCSPC